MTRQLPDQPLFAPPFTAMDRLQKQAAAFRELLDLEALPETGKQAQEASRQLGDMVLAGVAPPPHLTQLVAEQLSAFQRAKPRFVDVNTGMRLRYLEYGSGHSDVVLLLHDLGEAADIWAPLAARLAERGYHVFALDMRGHGDSGRSLDQRYGVEMLAEDVKAFIIARDLYVAPLAVVGCGMGAAVGLALAQQSPFLVGALVAAEFALPVAALREAAGSSSSRLQDGALGAASDERKLKSKPGASSHGVRSTQLMPWLGFRAGQASPFGSVQHCAAFLAHPLANVGPCLLLPLLQAAQAAAGGAPNPGSNGGSDSSRDGNDTETPAASLQQLFAQLQRPLRGAVASAFSLLRLPAGLTSRAGGGLWGGDGDFDDEGGPGGLAARMDPSFLFSFDPAALATGLANLRCHLLLVHGACSSWVDPSDASATAQLAAEAGAASAAAVAMPGAGHCLAADHPDQLLKQVVAFLEGPAIRCFDKRALHGTRAGAAAAGSASGASGQAAAPAPEPVPAGAAGSCRRPELLGLRPLPEYSSVEEARKALGPRSIPTADAVEAELRKLRVEEGRAGDDASSDEDEDDGGKGQGQDSGRGLGRRQTALAKDPADYFGFVG